MLVLGRTELESVFVGDEVLVTLLSRKGNKVQLNIIAPRHVRVLREEILDKTNQKAKSTRNSKSASEDGSLIVTRKRGQKVLIPSLNVTIIVAELCGNGARLGFEGPDSVRFRRAELPDSRLAS